MLYRVDSSNTAMKCMRRFLIMHVNPLHNEFWNDMNMFFAYCKILQHWLDAGERCSKMTVFPGIGISIIKIRSLLWEFLFWFDCVILLKLA